MTLLDTAVIQMMAWYHAYLLRLTTQFGLLNKRAFFYLRLPEPPSKVLSLIHPESLIPY